jgi:histidine triad (HIT) family protein
MASWQIVMEGPLNMITNAPAGYVCPFCRIARGEFGADGLLTMESDIVLRTDDVVAFVASHWWPHNPGHALIIPIKHFENLYELPKDTAAEVHEAARRLALAMKKAYGCPGISTRQHNEPAGGQDVWHYHLHVFPRFLNDGLYVNHEARRLTSAEERKPFGELLRRFLDRK